MNTPKPACPMNSLPCPFTLHLHTEPGCLNRFTSLLQSGIFLQADQGISLGDLLSSLPGFDSDYISGRIQTIFIDGLPADHLEQCLTGTASVIALSAAMPGLAGAIFRKNGIHASLRTTKDAPKTESAVPTTPIQIRLKLFNMIAEEKGAAILQSGCVIKGNSLANFFTYRQPLLKHIQKVSCNGTEISIPELLPLLADSEYIHLSMQELS